MTQPKNTRLAPLGSVAYLAGEYLHKNGPATEAELFLAVDFECVPKKRSEKLQCAIGTGWLAVTKDGKVDCGNIARAYYDSKSGEKKEDEVKPVGQITPAQYRPNIFASQGLSKKYLTNSRGMRSDIPTWSQRPGNFRIKTISGGDA